MKLSAAALTTILLLFGATTSRAAPPSAITNSLVADVSATARALGIADDAAISYAGRKKLQTFAVHDRALQAEALQALAEWSEGLRHAEAAEAAAPTIDHLGPVIFAFNGAFRADVPGAGLTAADAAGLERLRTLRTPDFDEAYVAMQVGALRHLLDLYTDYIKNGDDTELRALSVRQRPKVLAALAQLQRR